jgi:hypothetical protein
LLALIVSACSTPLSAYAQKNNRARQQDERNENERVTKAEHSLSDTKKDLAAIQKELRDESSRLEKHLLKLQQAKKNLRKTREDTEDRLGAKLGIPEALAKVRKAGAELEAVASKIRERVHADPVWNQIKEESDSAKETRAALQLDDLEQNGSGNHKQLKDLLKSILRPQELENEAIAKDSIAMEASKQLAIHQEDLERLRKLLPEGEVDKDRKVIQALSEVANEEKEHKEIQLKVSKVKTEAIKIQNRFTEAQLNLQKAKAADAADSNRPGKSKGK